MLIATHTSLHRLRVLFFKTHIRYDSKKVTIFTSRRGPVEAKAGVRQLVQLCPTMVVTAFKYRWSVYRRQRSEQQKAHKFSFRSWQALENRAEHKIFKPRVHVHLHPRGTFRQPPSKRLLPSHLVAHLNLARGGSAIQYKSPLNALKDTYDHSCCLAHSYEYDHLMTDSPRSISTASLSSASTTPLSLTASTTSTPPLQFGASSPPAYSRSICVRGMRSTQRASAAGTTKGGPIFHLEAEESPDKVAQRGGCMLQRDQVGQVRCEALLPDRARPVCGRALARRSRADAQYSF